MTHDMFVVLGIVVLAGAMMVSGKIRLDIVALLVVLAFVLGDVLTIPEALAGFGNSVVIMVAGLLVISEMLTRTGVAHHIGKWITRYGRDDEVRLLIIVALMVAVLGCFMSNTAVVAIFIPVVLSIANKTNLNASRLLLPLAYAGVVSGMLTLIATPANLVLSEELARSGFEPFGFFSFTPIGGTVLVVFVIYMILIGRHLLPGERFAPPKKADRNMQDLLDEFKVMGTAHRLQVPAGSSLIGQTLAESQIGSRYSAWVIIVEHAGLIRSGVTATPPPRFLIREGDVLVVHSPHDVAEQLAHDYGLHKLTVRAGDRARWSREAGIAKVLIHPESKLIGATIREVALLRAYGTQVLGIRRRGKVAEDFVDLRIKSGDAMLVIGPWNRIRQLQSELHDFVVLALPIEIERVAPAWHRAPAALGILALLVALAAFNIVPAVIAVTLCALLAVITRCLTMEQAYAGIHWSMIVLIAGMMSTAQAMVKTGTIEWLSGYLIAVVGQSGPQVMLVTLFALASGLGMVITGVASAILCAPIAISAANALEVSPYAFAMTVAIAASAGFAMPVSSAAVTLVVGPGKYRLTDFLKVGLPLLFLTGLVTLVLTPQLFPFYP